MKNDENRQADGILNWCATTARSVLSRMRAMGAAWALLGVVIGLNSPALVEWNAISFVANIIAWMIVMGLTGTMVSLFGGRPVDSWIGAAVGAVISGVVGFPTTTEIAPLMMQINFGALMGALVAATCWPWVRVILHVSARVRSIWS